MSGSLKPICVSCHRFYRPLKTGVWFLEGMPKYNGAPRGKGAAEHWEPYKLWRGDLWLCDGCGNQIISGVAWEPFREHYMPDFDEVLKTLKPILQVNDC